MEDPEPRSPNRKVLFDLTPSLYLRHRHVSSLLEALCLDTQHTNGQSFGYALPAASGRRLQRVSIPSQLLLFAVFLFGRTSDQPQPPGGPRWGFLPALRRDQTQNNCSREGPLRVASPFLHHPISLEWDS